MSSAVLPTVLAALGLVPDEDASPELRRGEAVLPLDLAVHEAARHPGSSVEPVEEQESPAAGRSAGSRCCAGVVASPDEDVERPSPAPDADEDSEEYPVAPGDTAG